VLTLSVVATVTVSSGPASAKEVGKETFATNPLQNAVLVLQVRSVIVPLGLVCVVCRPAQRRVKVKAKAVAVEGIKAKVKAKVMALLRWVTFRVKQMRKPSQRRV